MMMRISLVSVATLAILAAGCGKGDKGGDKKKGKTTSGSSECDETNDLKIVFGEKESPGLAAGPLEVKKTLGYISGMGQSKTVAKYAHVAVSNTADMKLGPYGALPPKNPGEVVLIVAFKTKNVPTELPQQRDNYNKLSVAPGTYKPGWMEMTRSFQVSAFLGGKGSGPALSGTGSGVATLTKSTPTRLCGSINMTTRAGSSIKGTFNVPIEMDLWKKKK
jgi:hypothetical protein